MYYISFLHHFLFEEQHYWSIYNTIQTEGDSIFVVVPSTCYFQLLLLYNYRNSTPLLVVLNLGIKRNHNVTDLVDTPDIIMEKFLIIPLIYF